MANPSADMIQDITTRFILTAPAEQLMFFESIMFLVEQAHWYYEDYVREQDSSLRSFGLKDFAALVFENCPELAEHVPNIGQIMEHFRAFKKNVPVMGAILLDRGLARVLLVKGWKNTACWGFPRGKIHKNESDAQCAVREVLEETGYDIEDLVREEDFIELTLDGKRNKLFIVAGLDPDSTQFAPKCKGEIGGYAWHRIADLPATRDEGNQTFLSDDGARHKFFMVWPYLKPLRKWIKRKQLDTPEWDMPASSGAAGGALEQQQQQQQQQQQRKARSRTAGAAGGGNGSAGGIGSGRSPLPDKVRALQQQPSIGGLGGTGGGAAAPASPQKHLAHLSFHEAAIAQAKQSGSISGPIRPGLVPLAPIAAAAAAAAAAGAGGVAGASDSSGSGTGSRPGPLPAPLVALLASGGAPAGHGGAAAGAAAPGAGMLSHKAFRFDRHAILSALG